MKDQPDILARFRLFKADHGGRSSHVRSGYRPQHLVRDDYLASGTHQYLDIEVVAPGESARATVKFLAPEAYPKSMRPGCLLQVQEGARLVGILTVLEVYNSTLLREQAGVIEPEEDGRVKCQECERRILPMTSQIHAGLCAPCGQEKAFRDSLPDTDQGKLELIGKTAQEGGAIYGIKLYRRIYESTLSEAKLAVESVLAEQDRTQE
ncbi:MAG: hypothetical protein ACI8W8_001594 [Rhodothermales bacterium]|jgi:hypothetical protein